MIKLIVSDKHPTSFMADWIKPIVEQYGTIEYYDPRKTYDIKSTVVIANVLDQSGWYKDLYQSGFNIVIDNLWETPTITKPLIDAHYCLNKNWFWYHESLWYRQLGYHTYVPNPGVSKNGLLLMHLKKLHRDWIFERLDLDKLLYSYVAAGFRINGDIDINDGDWQRYFNPEWYNSTAFSIVAETTMWRNDPLFITEKTFKPIAFQHPFIIFGQPGVLQYLHQQGFETFENIFDESYDTLTEIDVRITQIANQINNYSHKNYDLLTLEKLRHNKELFFNEQLVKDRIIKEILEPMIEYAET